MKASPLRILFLSDNFPPEVNAPAVRTFEHCRRWVKAGAQVTVITCAPNFPSGVLFPGYHNRAFSVEDQEGIRVIRVWSFMAANTGITLRTLDFISFAFSATIAGIFQRADVIVATSPQFFTAVSGALLARLKRRPWVFEVRDLWPASIVAVGAMKRNLIVRLLERLEAALYRAADRIVIVSDGFKPDIEKHLGSLEKVCTVPNGVDSQFAQTIPRDPALMNELNLHGKFVVGYFGTLGIAHGIDFIVHHAKKLENRHPHIHFLVAGDGAERRSIENLVSTLTPANLTLLPPLPKEAVPRYLSLLDSALVVLRKAEIFTTVLPSKIFEAAALRKPILLGVDGEARALVERYHAGLFFEPENDTEFELALGRLTADRNFYERCQAGGAELAQAYSRDTLAVQMLSALEKLTSISTTQTTLRSPSSNQAMM